MARELEKYLRRKGIPASGVRSAVTMPRMVVKPKKPSPTESSLLFEIDPEPAQERLTALGGLLLVQAFCFLGLPASAQRQRDYDEATFIESFALLNAAGGNVWRTSSVCRRIAAWRD